MGVADLLLAGRQRTDAFNEAVDDADTSDVVAVLALVGHADPQIRREVASVLPLLSHGDPPSAEMVAAAVRLSADADADVRDWACFALGQQWRDVDTPALRDALAARLDDDHVDTRCEALVGLAYRRDPRALPRVQAALTRETGDLWLLELVAAGALSDPQLHDDVLPHVTDWGDPKSDRIGDLVRRLTDPTGPGDDVLDNEAERIRRRAHGLAEHDQQPDGYLMSDLLEIAPHRAADFFEAVLARLAGDEAAEQELRERSYLQQLVDESR